MMQEGILAGTEFLGRCERLGSRCQEELEELVLVTGGRQAQGSRCREAGGSTWRRQGCLTHYLYVFSAQSEECDILIRCVVVSHCHLDL